MSLIIPWVEKLCLQLIMKKVLYIDGVVTVLVYPRCGIVTMSVCIRMRNIRNDTNHEETSCEMNHKISLFIHLVITYVDTKQHSRAH